MVKKVQTSLTRTVPDAPKSKKYIIIYYSGGNEV